MSQIVEEQKLMDAGNKTKIEGSQCKEDIVTASQGPEAVENKNVSRNVVEDIIKSSDTSEWILPDQWLLHRHKFSTADLIEFHREGKWFQHWGLYLGEGLVIHVSSFDLWNPSGGLAGPIVDASCGSSDASKRIVLVPLSTASSLPLTAEATGTLSQIANDIKEAIIGDWNDDEQEYVRYGEFEIKVSDPELGCHLEDRSKWFIKVENIIRIAGKDKFRINNVSSTFRSCIARSSEEIFRLATIFKDQEVNYSLLSCNCEHFVTSLKYKPGTNNPEATVLDVVPVVTPLGTSSQVRRAMTILSTASGTLFGILGAAFVLLLFKNKKSTSKKS